MKKKVKKIPKYNAGGSVLDTLLKNNPIGQNGTNAQSGATAGTIANGKTWETANNTQRTNMVVNAVAGGLDLLNMATSGQPATAGTALSGIAKGASAGAMFGPIGAGVGAAVGAIAGTAGRKHGYDKNSASTNFNDIYQEGSGWLSWFGTSSHEAKSDANRVQSSNIAKIQTEGIKADYMNNPNVQAQPILAAEGGIMRKPVDALVSKGELIYDPTTKKLRQVPGSKGKPNKADDVFARLYEGDVVISNSPTMMMSNGKTPAQNLMGMVDKYATGGTVKAREAIIKKVVNWQEANKTKPQEYAKFDEGYPGFFKYLMDNRIRPLGAVMSEWFSQLGEEAPKFDGFDKLDFLNSLKNIYKAQLNYEAPIKLRDDFNWDQHRSVPIDQLFEFNPNILATKVEKPKNTSTRSTAKMNYSPQNVGIHTHSEIDPVWSRHKTSDYGVTETTPSVSTINVVKKDPTVASKKGTANKSVSNDKTTSNGLQETKLTPEQIAESLRIADIGERHWLRGDRPGNAVSEIKRPLASFATTATPEKLKIQKIDPAAVSTRSGNPRETTESKTDWGDLAYKAASIFTPLFDREKAESVQYQVPIVKYRPTYVNVDPQRRAIDESYAMARYNQANISPNTGAGMAYGLQAATNRAKQLSDVYSWQTNTQNNLIGRNVDTYNKWSADYANIMNNVYDKAAANRATARNINRQNVATALKNWGQIRRDDKAYEMDRMKLQMLDPMLQYGYENYYNYLKWKKENGYG